MKSFRQFFKDARRHKGLALIIVLSMLALTTIVMLAFLSVADTEHKGTLTYSASQTARRLADTATNIVISQIQAGAEQDPMAGRETHATQPGAVRKYSQQGGFLAGYKLFSDAEMIFQSTGSVTGAGSTSDEREFLAKSEPPADWNSGANLLRYVDLNEPIVKGVVGATGDAVSAKVYFPILDPRAAFDMDPAGGAPIPAEGFTYETTMALTGVDISKPFDNGATTINPIVKPTAATAPDNLRLAMPVQWLYVLQDGNIGNLNSALEFVGSGSSLPSVDNPIVGRIAFWTDDETCKININTASEPSFMGQPLYYHERDHRWADYTAARGEYQRFPGHPATVALSSVLYPNPFQSNARNLDTYGIAGASPRGVSEQRNIMSIKNRIYDLVPKIAQGGSEGGTKLFASDDYISGSGGLTAAVDLSNSLKERLYTSVDELFFSETVTGNFRTPNVTSISGGNLFNQSTLERTSGFLTAHSRASEISNLGLPRIAMWPVHSQATKRTPFDNLITYCSLLGKTNFNNINFNNSNLYIFQRQQARDQFNDIKIPRNAKLLKMLDQILADVTFPGMSATGGAGRTFKNKMGNAGGYQNYRQVIVEMFDYIRSTNLRDSYLVPARNTWARIPIYWGDDANNLTGSNIYDQRDNLESSFNTFTVGVVRNQGNTNNDPFSDVALPGHGQVTPSVWDIGPNYRGFGRSISISEIGLQFICTADGQPDMYSWRHLTFVPPAPGAPPEDKGGYNITHVPMTEEKVTRTQQVDRQALYDLAMQGVVSGGRTALAVPQDALIRDGVRIQHEDPFGFSNIRNARAEFWNDGYSPPERIKKRYYSNFPPLSDVSVADELYGTVGGALNNDTRGKHRQFHPGTKPENWNHSLEINKPLGPNPQNPVHEKRIQALLHLEFFCPSVGYTGITPEFTIVIGGNELSSIETNGEVLFDSENLILKSAKPIYQVDGAPEVGGYVSFRRVAGSRGLPPRNDLPADSLYFEGATGSIHGGIMNMDLVSRFFTVRADDPLVFKSGDQQPIKIEIYDSHDYVSKSPIQTIYFKFPEGQAPVPDLIVQPSQKAKWIRTSDSAIFEHPAVQAPHWWSFHQEGVLGRSKGSLKDGVLPIWIGRFADPNSSAWNIPGQPNNPFGLRVGGLDGESARDAPDNIPAIQAYPGCRSLIYGYENVTNYRDVRRIDNAEQDDNLLRATRAAYEPGLNPNDQKPTYNILAKHFGSDVVRSIQPGHGDPRLIAGKSVVRETEWSKHPLYDSDRAFLAHNFSSYGAGSEPGFDRFGDVTAQAAEPPRTEDDTRRLLPRSIRMDQGHVPDAPYSGTNSPGQNPTTGSLSPAFLAQRYYDFDDSDPGGRIGAFINKADEGNFSVGDFQATGWPVPKQWRATYFRASSFGARFAPGAPSFFTPNRMVSSPVMMGSLPSRLYFSDRLGQDASQNGNGAWTNLLFRPHVQVEGAQTGHPGSETPPDHYLLDLFWMPVVEPYAISEPLSTAGKVNMNYQMMPFTHIRRATAMHAVMKDEIFAALPNADHSRSRSTRVGFGPQGTTPPRFHEEVSTGAGPIHAAARWHRSIAIDRLNSENGTADNAWWNVPANARVQATLRQFEERFNFSGNATGKGASGIGGPAGGLPGGFRAGLFRSASQICEIHLIPSRVLTSNASTGSGTVPAVTNATENINPTSLNTYNGRETAMQNFWTNHCSTGDNTRERPYSNLYAKLTTRSNTFRVHVRAQSILKAKRGSNPDGFDAAEDEITGEFRGSFLLERYIDQADLAAAGTKADFTEGNPMDETNHPPLDSYYRFRVLESKRFAP